MNFYSVKIGNRTRRGHFNESISFVCKTANDSDYDVQAHWTNHYKGFEVFVSKVKEVIEIDIKGSLETGSKEIKEFKREIKRLESQLNRPKITHFHGKFDYKYFPEEAKEIVKKIKEAKSKVYNLKNEATDLIEDHLLKINKDRVSWIRIDDGFDDRFDTFSYEAKLKGSIIENFDKEINS
jgi:hypothetical protein